MVRGKYVSRNFEYWVTILDTGYWIINLILDTGFDTRSLILDRLGPGYWILCPWYWILDTVYWVLDTGFWILDTWSLIVDTGYWILDIEKLSSALLLSIRRILYREVNTLPPSVFCLLECLYMIFLRESPHCSDN